MSSNTESIGNGGGCQMPENEPGCPPSNPPSPTGMPDDAIFAEIAAACDAGMRLSLPASEIVARVRAALARRSHG